MRLLPAALILALVSLAPGCRSGSRPPPAVLLPETNEVQGWSKVGQTRTFEAGTLWQYINGEAEKYIRAGVERTLTADYRYRDKLEAVADIHAMSTREGATSVFGSEPATGSDPIALGDAGRLYEGSVTFHKGSYLVRLVAYQKTTETATALLELARGIERKLP